MMEEQDKPPTRVIVSAEGEQFAPRNFVLVYLKDNDVQAVIGIDDMTYNQCLLMLSEVVGIASEFTDGFVDNFFDEEAEEDGKERV